MSKNSMLFYMIIIILDVMFIIYVMYHIIIYYIECGLWDIVHADICA